MLWFLTQMCRLLLGHRFLARPLLAGVRQCNERKQCGAMVPNPATGKQTKTAVEMHGLDTDQPHGHRDDPSEARSACLVIIMRSLHHLSTGFGDFLIPVLSHCHHDPLCKFGEFSWYYLSVPALATTCDRCSPYRQNRDLYHLTLSFVRQISGTKSVLQ
ncbi:hypothetical protein EDD17DRAFT_1034344 [Pisolithus thermaeus]|nr:hypothetical protein EDD17DRAFT_1034344 [Pisolithus thermaeus]